jgi:putative hemolysin
MGERLAALGVPAHIAPEAGFALVIAVTTYLSLVIGELVPKQLALRSAEAIAVIMARPMAITAIIAAPLVWLLDESSTLVLRLVGMAGAGGQDVTTEELEMIFAEATRSGVIEEDERALMTSVMRLAERPVRDLMTPRTELHWIDLSAGDAALRDAIAGCPHSLLLVADGSRRSGASGHADEKAGDRARPARRDGRLAPDPARRSGAGAGPRRIWPSRRDPDPGRPARRAGRHIRVAWRRR